MLISTQTQVGTPAYMAPEQHMGYPCFASDQYSLAVMIYEWICGVRPFQGTALGLAVQHMNTAPPKLRDHLPELSEAVELVILKALAKDPGDRYARIEEMASAFHEAVQPPQPTVVLAQPIEASKTVPLVFPEQVSQLASGPDAEAFVALRQNVRSIPPLPQSVQPTPALQEKRRRRKSLWYIFLAVLLVLIVIGGSFGALFLLNKGNTNSAISGNTGDSVFFQDGTLHNDQLRIEMHHVAPLPRGQTCFAWLQDATQHIQLLGALSVQNGNVSFLYQGDGKTNLISITQGVFITAEGTGQTPQRPGDHKAYQATFDPRLLEGLKRLLYATPGLPDQNSVIATILDTLHSINDKAGSVVDTLNSDNALAMRQTTRILELLENSQQAQGSGDLPARYPSQLNVTIGLLSSPSQPGYLDILDTQLKQLEPLVAHNANAQQHLNNIKSALADLRDWVQKMHDYDIQLLNAANLQDPVTSSIALQLKQISSDSFTGRTPPNAKPLPAPGSAGALQAYTEAQYMAMLSLQPA